MNIWDEEKQQQAAEGAMGLSNADYWADRAEKYAGETQAEWYEARPGIPSLFVELSSAKTLLEWEQIARKSTAVELIKLEAWVKAKLPFVDDGEERERMKFMADEIVEVFGERARALDKALRATTNRNDYERLVQSADSHEYRRFQEYVVSDLGNSADEVDQEWRAKHISFGLEETPESYMGILIEHDVLAQENGQKIAGIVTDANGVEARKEAMSALTGKDLSDLKAWATRNAKRAESELLVIAADEEIDAREAGASGIARALSKRAEQLINLKTAYLKQNIDLHLAVSTAIKHVFEISPKNEASEGGALSPVVRNYFSSPSLELASAEELVMFVRNVRTRPEGTKVEDILGKSESTGIGEEPVKNSPLDDILRDRVVHPVESTLTTGHSVSR